MQTADQIISVVDSKYRRAAWCCTYIIQCIVYVINGGNLVSTYSTWIVRNPVRVIFIKWNNCNYMGYASFIVVGTRILRHRLL